MISNFIYLVLKCLLLTIVIEVSISLIIGIRNKKDLLIITLANIFTNVLVTTITMLVNYYIGYVPAIIALCILEAFALVSEGYIYSKKLNYKKLNPYVISLILNLSSYIIGEIINTF